MLCPQCILQVGIGYDSCNWSLKLGSGILLLGAPGNNPFYASVLVLPTSNCKGYMAVQNSCIFIDMIKFVSTHASFTFLLQIPSLTFKHQNTQYGLSTLRMCARIFMRHLD